MQVATQSMALPSAWIDKLFARLALTYGNKFADMWRDQSLPDVKAFWAEKLAAFTAPELRTAMDSLFATHPTWPPTLPEFCALCRPPAVKVNHEAAFHEAIRGVEHRKRGDMGAWSSPAVYWAAMDVSAFDLLNSTWPQIRARWVHALDARLADASLPVIPEPPLQLPAPEISGDVDAENLQRLVAMIERRPKVGPRAWATTILERKANGDPYLQPIAVKFALDAERIAAGGAPRNNA